MQQGSFTAWVLPVVLVLTSCAPVATQTPEPAPTQRSIPTSTVGSPTQTIPTPTSGAMIEVGLSQRYADGSMLIAVPAGEFLMGGDDDDNPRHSVSLGDFWIYETAVTNQQYAWCESLGHCTAPDAEANSVYGDVRWANNPVVGVNYEQAASYCAFVHGRLPTEAEWEKAAHSPDGNPYPWGAAAPSCALLNFNDCVGATSIVLRYANGASFYGALDMAGNVFEWVADWYGAGYYEISPSADPQGPESGTQRVVRSSNYASGADQVPVATRFAADPQIQRPDLGFRCAVKDPANLAPLCNSLPVYSSEAGGTQERSEACPDLNIEQAPYCVQEKPVTNVTFSGPENAKIDYGPCIPSGDPKLFTCQTPGVIVSITAGCQLVRSGAAACQPGFSLKDGQCVADGSAGECLPGWEYDDSAQCCTSASGGESSASAPICPVGTFFSSIHQACLPSPAQELVSVSVEVEFLPVASCKAAGGGGGGGGGGGAGGPTACVPQQCTFGDWDPNMCCCTDPFNPGLCY